MKLRKFRTTYEAPEGPRVAMRTKDHGRKYRRLWEAFSNRACYDEGPKSFRIILAAHRGGRAEFHLEPWSTSLPAEGAGR